jgi:hypothetical protein
MKSNIITHQEQRIEIFFNLYFLISIENSSLGDIGGRSGIVN